MVRLHVYLNWHEHCVHLIVFDDIFKIQSLKFQPRKRNKLNLFMKLKSVWCCHFFRAFDLIWKSQYARLINSSKSKYQTKASYASTAYFWFHKNSFNYWHRQHLHYDCKCYNGNIVTVAIWKLWYGKKNDRKWSSKMQRNRTENLGIRRRRGRAATAAAR